MKKPSDPQSSREELRQSIIGLGEKSIRKSYYPELQQRVTELERTNRELEEEIRERREAQANARTLAAQLQQSQKMEALGRLAGGIAHDFNNILTAISGFAELAQLHINENCPKEGCSVDRDLSQVILAAGRARDLIQQILTFTRKQEYDKQAIVLGEVVAEALRLLRSTLPQTVEIRSRGLESQSKIRGNATQIHQVIMNLGTNAIHAMEESSGTLVVELDEVELSASDHKTIGLEVVPGNYLLLRICDTGCGMEKGVLDKIFDPYFTTKPKGRGSGMGLAVVHGIVKDHDGHISVYSEPGKGSSFVIYLPIYAGEELEKQHRGKSDNAVHGTEHILLIDDEPLILEVEARLLESLGYTVQTCGDPLKALALFQQEADKFDLVMTDMTMPKMHGGLLTSELLRFRPDIPIIICTGFSSILNEQKAFAIGAKAYVMKPLVRNTIARLLRQVLEHEQNS